MSRPLKVIRVIARLNIGGPAVYVSLLTRHLAEPEFDNLLVVGSVPPEEGDMTYYAEGLGLTPLVLPEMSREVSLGNDFRAAVALWRLFRRERPDVVDTHTAKAGTVGRLAAWLAGVPVIVHTFHGHVLRGYFSPRKTAFFRQLERFLAKRTTRILAVSETVRRELLDLGIGTETNFGVCELGLDLDPFAAAAEAGTAVLRRELGLAPETPLVGTCGRMVPIKNQAMLIAAAAQVHAVRPEVHFVLIGDGELHDELAGQVTAAGLDEVFHFAGWRADTPQLYPDLDLFVLTSRNEGTPVTIIEAMAAGVACVSTAVGGVPDVIVDGETGWLVPDDDATALGQQILAALADPAACRQLAATAQQRALARWSYRRMVADMGQLYRELVAQAKVRR